MPRRSRSSWLPDRARGTGILLGLILLLAPVATGAAGGMGQARNLLVKRSLPPQAQACLDCHRKTTPALVVEWSESAHARAGVTCHNCHISDETAPTTSRAHFDNYRPDSKLPGSSPQMRLAVTAVVTPRACARCHPDQVWQFGQSKHAATLDILPRAYPGLPALSDQLPGAEPACRACHGSVVRFQQGRPVAGTWPNLGIGRLNPDGSRGTCTACHGRHRFSKMSARKPEACQRCHSGPAHPQAAIYAASQHGAIYAAEGESWSWDLAPLAWGGGRGYRAPTCAACHMGGVPGRLMPDHDVSARLSWELQAPRSLRPQHFAPRPARRPWRQARGEMRLVCLQCHAPALVDNQFQRLDAAVAGYNRDYFDPARRLYKRLVAQGRVDPQDPLASPGGVSFYRLWQIHGRQARMGTAMMAPDYAWWHGFYQCKKDLSALERQAGLPGRN